MTAGYKDFEDLQPPNLINAAPINIKFNYGFYYTWAMLLFPIMFLVTAVIGQLNANHNEIKDDQQSLIQQNPGSEESGQLAPDCLSVGVDNRIGMDSFSSLVLPPPYA